MLRISCLLDDLAPPLYIPGHPIAHFCRRAPPRFKSEPQHPLPNVGRRQRPSDLSAEPGDDFGGNADGRSGRLLSFPSTLFQQRT